MVDISKLKQLREETGISFALCKKALEATNNNIGKAKAKLNEWGTEKMTEKSTRSTSEGGIFAYIHHNKKIASLIELLCETDFVANNKDFQNLGQEIAMQLASMPAKTTEELMKQEYIRDPSRKVENLIKEAVLKFGENIKIGKMVRLVLGVK
jgi:elongation factor Ts